MNVSDASRYVYLKNVEAWLDLRHVVSAAHNLTTQLGMGDLAGAAFESVQATTRWRHSAWSREDLASNFIGAQTAWNYPRGYCACMGLTFGQYVQLYLLDMGTGPVTREEAMRAHGLP